MINHDVQPLGLVAADAGEIVLPSENESIKFEGTVRQFVILARRAYSEQALECLADSEGIKLQNYEDSVDVAPYFGLTLRVQPEGDLESFVEEQGDDFFDSVLKIVSKSNVRGVRGNRCAFVREFRAVNDAQYGKLLETKILVGTSVFFNDYRVTTGFPYDEESLDVATESIYNELCAQWGELKIDVTPEVIEEESDEFNF